MFSGPAEADEEGEATEADVRPGIFGEERVLGLEIDVDIDVERTG